MDHNSDCKCRRAKNSDMAPGKGPGLDDTMAQMAEQATWIYMDK